MNSFLLNSKSIQSRVSFEWIVATNGQHPIFWYVINTTAHHLGRYKLSSPRTKELDSITSRGKEWPNNKQVCNEFVFAESISTDLALKGVRRL